MNLGNMYFGKEDIICCTTPTDKLYLGLNKPTILRRG